MESCVCLLSPQSWLRMYGYLPQASRQMSTMRSAQILSGAVSDMQRFYGLEVTGKMDPETIRLASPFHGTNLQHRPSFSTDSFSLLRSAMKRPRCGVPDKFGGQIKTNVRRKRYALTGHKWSKKQLTYR